MLGILTVVILFLAKDCVSIHQIVFGNFTDTISLSMNEFGRHAITPSGNVTDVSLLPAMHLSVILLPQPEGPSRQVTPHAAFSKNFMAVCEFRINRSNDCHLIVVHCFICHLLIPFHPSGKFSFYVFICIPLRHHLCHLFFIRQASCGLFLFSAPTKTDFRDS